ncbi:MAG: FapA family protein [Clostridiaceae bacterium]|nr:FapA family protein [Clostridiaceae bacterium]
MGENDMLKGGFEIAFSDDAAEAYVILHDASGEYTKESIAQCLKDLEVTTGLDDKMIDTLLSERVTEKKYLVAASQKPVDGKDGWFEFLFDTDIDTRPKILKDGSVDYSAYGNVPAVEMDQQLVVYHPATQSRDGVNLHGETLVAVKGKELARLKGRGFYVSEDGLGYFAKEDGRAAFDGDRLVVENELLIDGDASYSTGDVNFINDIHIRGNVLSGVVITSKKGMIIVDGYVESCELYAAKDIVLKNGMQGNGKGKIVAGGSVSGKFFEQVSIQSGGDVCANAIMNCTVEARDDITVSGRFGVIIGGALHAGRCISATIIGNMAEVRTQIFAGSEENLLAKLIDIEKQQEQLEEELKKIVTGIGQLEALMKKTEKEEWKQQKRLLIRGKLEKEAQINEKIRCKQEVMDQMSRADAARVTVQKMMYPGTRININGVKKAIQDEIFNVQIVSKGSVIEILQ